jgi:hypothetical protein
MHMGHDHVLAMIPQKFAVNMRWYYIDGRSCSKAGISTLNPACIGKKLKKTTLNLSNEAASGNFFSFEQNRPVNSPN